jgi:hypothetical protein
MTIEELIEEYDLKSSSRKREMVYMRYVIYKYLSENKYTYTAIAKLFNKKQHGTVLHALKKIDKFMEYPKQYPDFHKIKNEVMFRLGLNANFKKKLPLSNLENKVLDCKSYIDLLNLQNELTKNLLEREDEVEIFTTFDI